MARVLEGVVGHAERLRARRAAVADPHPRVRPVHAPATGEATLDAEVEADLEQRLVRDGDLAEVDPEAELAARHLGVAAVLLGRRRWWRRPALDDVDIVGSLRVRGDR